MNDAFIFKKELPSQTLTQMSSHGCRNYRQETKPRRNILWYKTTPKGQGYTKERIQARG